MTPFVIAGVAVATLIGYAWLNRKTNTSTTSQGPEPYTEIPPAVLQHALELLGYETDPTGIYDAQTINAVRIYQARHGGLQVDGVVGPMTHAAIVTDLKDIGLYNEVFSS